VILVLLDLKGQQEQLEILELLVHKVILVLLVHKVHQALLVHKD
jgi:hypothetical protein